MVRQVTSPLGWYIALSVLLHSVCIAWALFTFRGLLAGDEVPAPVRVNLAAPPLPAVSAAVETALMPPAVAPPTQAFVPELPVLTASVATPQVISPPTAIATPSPRLVPPHSLPEVVAVAAVKLPALTPPPTPRARPPAEASSLAPLPASPVRSTPPEVRVAPQEPPRLSTPPVRREPPAPPLTRVEAPAAPQLPAVTASDPVPHAHPVAPPFATPPVATPPVPEALPPVPHPPSPPLAAVPPSPLPLEQGPGPRPQPQLLTTPSLASAAPTPSLSAQPESAPQASSPPGQPSAEALPHFAYKPCPQYPYVARRRGLEGTVQLRVQMRPDGSVGEVQIVTSSGHHALDNAAMRAVQKWTAVPTRNGAQTSRWANVPVHFRLQQANGAGSREDSATLSHLNCDPS